MFTRTLESRRDQHEPVFEQIEAGVPLDQILLLCVIHPIEIRGEEDVRRRALFNLLDERAAGRVGNDRFLSGLAMPLSGNLVESVLQACGREYDNILALRRDWLNSTSPRQPCGDEQGEASSSCRHHSLRLRCSSKHIGSDNTAASAGSITGRGTLPHSRERRHRNSLNPGALCSLVRGSVTTLRRMDQVDSPWFKL
jgi:hypothetical protein